MFPEVILWDSVAGRHSGHGFVLFLPGFMDGRRWESIARESSCVDAMG